MHKTKASYFQWMEETELSVLGIYLFWSFSWPSEKDSTTVDTQYILIENKHFYT